MSSRYLAVAFAVALLGAGGWALAQQDVPPPPQPPVIPIIPPNPAPPPPGLPPAPAMVPRPGRYAVVQAGKSALLVDTATGRTWELERGSSGAAWVPVRRLDSDKDVRDWQKAANGTGRSDDGLRAERDRAVEEAKDLAERARQAEAAARLAAEEARRALDDAAKQLKALQQKRDK
jgi:hypothetical protein